MIYTPPPSIPTFAYEVANECKRGSRDCFPEDRVGAVAPPSEDEIVVSVAFVAPDSLV